MAMIRFACPSCKAGLKATADKAGKKVPYPRCKHAVQIPSPGKERPKVVPATKSPRTVPGGKGPLRKLPAIPPVALILGGVGLVCFLSCLAFGGLLSISGLKQLEQAEKMIREEEQQVRQDVEEADRLWQSGQKAQAVARYKSLIDGHAWMIPDTDRPTVYQRAIEYEAEQGNTSSAKGLIDKALAQKVALSFTNPQANAILKETQAQKPAPVLQEDDPPGVLSARYLPHRPGTTRSYDTVMYAEDGSKPVVRTKYSYEDGGVIRRTTVRLGQLDGKSVADPQAKIRWLKDVNVPADQPEHYRRNGEFIEIGTHLDGTEITWRRVLKVGTKPGDTWVQDVAGTQITFTFNGFTEHKGRPAATVREDMALPRSLTVIFHTYVKNVGEVSRMTSSVPGGGKVPKIIGDIVLVE
jgi:hypothetical protein